MTLVTLSFAPEMEEAILQGRKCCTSRKERKGEVGDVFLVKDRLYRICHINVSGLLTVAHQLYDAEGFKSKEDFESFWNDKIGHSDESEYVFIHFFAYLCDICKFFNTGECWPDGAHCPASEVCNHE